MTQVTLAAHTEKLPMQRKFWHELGIFKEDDHSEFHFSGAVTSSKKANNAISAAAGDWDCFSSELEFE